MGEVLFATGVADIAGRSGPGELAAGCLTNDAFFFSLFLGGGAASDMLSSVFRSLRCFLLLAWMCAPGPANWYCADTTVVAAVGGLEGVVSMRALAVVVRAGLGRAGFPLLLAFDRCRDIWEP